MKGKREFLKTKGGNVWHLPSAKGNTTLCGSLGIEWPVKLKAVVHSIRFPEPMCMACRERADV